MTDLSPRQRETLALIAEGLTDREIADRLNLGVVTVRQHRKGGRTVKFLARFRRRAKVEITCPHGTFIPGAYRLGQSPNRYGCKRCGFELRLSTFRGDITW